MNTPTVEDLNDLSPGISAEKYYHPWLLLVICWRSLWTTSRTDWRRYARRINDMFEARVRSSLRMGRGLDGFIAQFSRAFDLVFLGANEEERTAVAFLLSLPEQEQQRILVQMRTNLPVLLLCLRLYRDQRKADMGANL